MQRKVREWPIGGLSRVEKGVRTTDPRVDGWGEKETRCLWLKCRTVTELIDDIKSAASQFFPWLWVPGLFLLPSLSTLCGTNDQFEYRRLSGCLSDSGCCWSAGTWGIWAEEGSNCAPRVSEWIEIGINSSATEGRAAEAAGVEEVYLPGNIGISTHSLGTELEHIPSEV